MRSMSILPTISTNSIIRDSIMSSPSPTSGQFVTTEPFENPSGWVDCSTSTIAPPDLPPSSIALISPRVPRAEGLCLSLYASRALCHFLSDDPQPTAPTHALISFGFISVSYTHLRAHETVLDLVCR